MTVFEWYLLCFKLDDAPIGLQGHTIEILLQSLFGPSSCTESLRLGVVGLGGTQEREERERIMRGKEQRGKRDRKLKAREKTINLILRYVQQECVYNVQY